MKKVFIILIVVLLMVNSLNFAYGFEQYVRMVDELKAMGDVEIPEYNNQTSIKSPLNPKVYVSKIIGVEEDTYIGQVDETGLYHGRGGIKSSLSLNRWLTEGNFCHGKKNGYCIDRDCDKYDSIWYQDTFIEEFYLEMSKNMFVKLYVGTPGIRFSVLDEDGLLYNRSGNFDKGSVVEIDNIIYFPMREVLEYFNNVVSWDVVKGTTINGLISITTDSNIITVSGNSVILSDTVKIIDGVTYVPIDFMTKAFENSFNYTIDTTSYIIPIVTIVKNIVE